MDWTKCTYEQLWFPWSSWALWPNWNENQIFMYRLFAIPVVLAKRNEKFYLLYMCTFFICIFVGRDTDVTVHEEEDTSKKLIQKFWFAKECQRDVVQTLLWLEKHMDEIVITSSRKRFLYVDAISKRWTTTELCIVQRIRRWRFLTEWSLWNESDRCHQNNGLYRLFKKECPFHYFFCDVFRHYPELDEYPGRYPKMMGYTKVFERDKKKFVSSWKHVRISIHKMTTDMKDVILQRVVWMSTSTRLRKIEIAFIDVMEQLEIMDVGLVGTECKHIIMTFIERNLTKWTRWYRIWNTVM